MWEMIILHKGWSENDHLYKKMVVNSSILVTGVVFLGSFIAGLTIIVLLARNQSKKGFGGKKK